MRRQYTDEEEKTWEVGRLPSPQNQYGRGTPSYTYSYMAEDGQQGVRDSKLYQFRFSQPRNSETGGRGSSSGTPTNGGEVFVRGTLGGRDIEALEMSKVPGKASTNYKGRYRMWPGLIFILLLIGGAATLATFEAVKARTNSQDRDRAYEQARFNSTTIDDGNTMNKSVTGKDIVSDDGAVGNPKTYPLSTCELPDYQSKNGHIVAVSANGTEVPLKIKGLNWFGMETYVILGSLVYWMKTDALLCKQGSSHSFWHVG